jgi:hypothetical protein
MPQRLGNVILGFSQQTPMPQAAVSSTDYGGGKRRAGIKRVRSRSQPRGWSVVIHRPAVTS